MKSKRQQKKIAKERIEILFKEAEKAKTQQLKDRYVELARKLAMKYKVRMPSLYKRRFCKHCYAYFTKDNVRIRTRKGYIVYYCLKCKKFSRFVYRNPRAVRSAR